MKLVIGIIGQLLFISSFFGQDSISKNRFSPALNFQLAYIPKTYPIAPVTKGGIIGNAELFWQFNGRDLWHQYYNYPRGGAEIIYADLGNSAELGYALGFIPCLDIRTKGESGKWRFKIGFGVAYFNKPFDPVTNSKNYYIGSSVVNMTHFSFRRENKINDNLACVFGLSMIHSSNGHTTLPNVGLNMFSIDAGILFSKKEKKKSFEYVENKHINAYTFKFGVGVHEFGETEKAVGGPNYPSYHFSFWYNRSFKRIHSLQAGVILAYYTSFYDYITNQEVYSSSQRLRSNTGIAFIGHEFIFGKFGLVTQGGIYFYNPFFRELKKLEGTWGSTSMKLESVFSNRLGLNFYPFKKRNTLNDIRKQLSMGIYIKTNLFQADLFEYSISYTF